MYRLHNQDLKIERSKKMKEKPSSFNLLRYSFIILQSAVTVNNIIGASIYDKTLAVDIYLCVSEFLKQKSPAKLFGSSSFCFSSSSTLSPILQLNCPGHQTVRGMHVALIN